MRRLNILVWHIHGSYLNALARIDHNWYVPTRPEGGEGYIGRGTTFNMPDNLIEVPAEQVRDLDLDLIVYQTPRNWTVDAEQILSEPQQRLPSIYLEHNTPKPDAVNQRHPVDDPNMLLVHVTHFNRLMWDNGRTPTTVIEHAVAIDPAIRYRGTLERGITVVNGMQKRPRIAGYDIFLDVREQIPLDVAGMETEAFGGLGDIPYRHLHQRVADYRFLFSPPLAVIEALTLGMPVVALATTELPTVIEHGVSGFVSCDIDELVSCMRELLAYPDLARSIGQRARELALQRFSLERFANDWNAAFAEATGIPASMFNPQPIEVEALV
jgi:hypothetical protein